MTSVYLLKQYLMILLVVPKVFKYVVKKNRKHPEENLVVFQILYKDVYEKFINFI